MNNQKKSTSSDARFIVKIGIALLIISAVTAGLLSFVNAITKDKIAANELEALKEIVSEVFPDYEKIEEHKGDFGDTVEYVYDVYKGGDVAGFCIQVSSYGFKDYMTVVVCTDRLGKCLDVEITSISDTPGVGTKVNDENYLSGYNGRNAEQAAQYDTISGATISSSALRRAVHAALSIDVFDKPVAATQKKDDLSQNGDVEETTAPVAPSESTVSEFKTPETTENIEKKLFNPKVDKTVAVTRRSETYPDDTTSAEPEITADESGTGTGTDTGTGTGTTVPGQTLKEGETTIPGETTNKNETKKSSEGTTKTGETRKTPEETTKTVVTEKGSEGSSQTKQKENPASSGSAN